MVLISEVIVSLSMSQLRNLKELHSVSDLMLETISKRNKVTHLALEIITSVGAVMASVIMETVMASVIMEAVMASALALMDKFQVSNQAITLAIMTLVTEALAVDLEEEEVPEVVLEDVVEGVEDLITSVIDLMEVDSVIIRVNLEATIITLPQSTMPHHMMEEIEEDLIISLPHHLQLQLKLSLKELLIEE